MAVWVAGLLLAISVPVYVTGLPSNFIIKVVAHCGDGKSNGNIEVISDLSVRVTAKCKNGLQLFNATDAAHCILPITFKDNGGARCVLEKREGATVYTTTVYVAWGEKGSPIITNAEQYVVSCSFGDYGVKSTASKQALRGLIAPAELQFNKGPRLSSSIHLGLVDVKGASIGPNIPAQRKIQIKATTDGKDGEVGIRVSSCDVVGINSKERYAVLRAGCGDGIIFRKDEGFTTVGKSSFSPYFVSFHLGDDKNIKFDCNFTTCNTSCDGSSCRTERRRRFVLESREHHGSIQIQSDMYSPADREIGTTKHVSEVIRISPKVNQLANEDDHSRPLANEDQYSRPLAHEDDHSRPLAHEDDLHRPLANDDDRSADEFELSPPQAEDDNLPSDWDDLPPQMSQEAVLGPDSAHLPLYNPDLSPHNADEADRHQPLLRMDDAHRPFVKQNKEDVLSGTSDWPILPWPAVVALTLLCLMSLGLSLYSFVLFNRRESVPS
ncbi:vitelline envelope sperm lysin receptor-like [Haliotis rubra]|uniref:vitelline envelope sperm lysin receptor-like n=1 Tax=Haliotis rubra TaxID=36100 RepID=UPI001EE5A57C|nr:vitelline envelope sperm lysin receptor-like [Haliotis rubra]XP_046576672.1 vitelline envelope sperm lysin receptor-like [Haliotis rubra]